MRYLGVLVFAIAFFALRSTCLAQPVSSGQLISGAKNYDGKSVTYSGEAIGDVMVRGDHAWINVNDGANAIGVWITRDMAKEILTVGDYKHSGDMVEVVGMFNRVCVEHGGDLDIHAQTLHIVSAGSPNGRSIDKSKKDWAIKLLGVVALIWILSLLKIR